MAAALADEIRTPRLVLRPFTAADAGAVFAYSTSHVDWGRFQSLPRPYTMRHAEAFVAELIARPRDARPSWAITLEAAVIGIVSLGFEAEYRIAVLGYGVHAAHWGSGIVVEAAGEVVDRAFREHAGLARIGAHTDARNDRSLRVLAKLGFRTEGTLRSSVFAQGELIDDAVSGLLRGEWRRSGR